MFNGYSIGDFVVDLSFQVISSDFTQKQGMKVVGTWPAI